MSRPATARYAGQDSTSAMRDRPRRVNVTSPGDSSHLTPRETAALLRVTPHTVYRWLRSGRLRAIKVGKEWRIPADQLHRTKEPAGLMPLKDLLSQLAGEAEHLLGLASDGAGLAQMEAIFFETASAAGGQLVHIRWGDDQKEMERLLRPVLGTRAAGRSGPRVLDFAGAYERHGLAGPGRLLAAEIERAKARGRFCYAYSSCYEYFGFHHDRLASFQSEITRNMGDQPLFYLCGFVISKLHEAMPTSVVLQLVANHSGTIFFDGQRALLVRPAR